MLRQYYLADLLESPYEEQKDTPDGAAFSEGIRRGYNLTLLLRVKDREGEADGQNVRKRGKETVPAITMRDTSVSGLKRFIIGM